MHNPVLGPSLLKPGSPSSKNKPKDLLTRVEHYTWKRFMRATSKILKLETKRRNADAPF